MSKTKEAVTVFCNFLKCTVNSKLTPDHIRIAKYNQSCDNSIDAFWDTLDSLTYVALKIKTKHHSDFESILSEYDQYSKVKIRLALMKNPMIDVYCLSEKNNYQTRMLLCALCWLIEDCDVLDFIVRLKLINSSLGREHLKVDTVKKECENQVQLKSVDAQIQNLMIKSNKLSHNIKDIFELVLEKVKLTTKIHAASIGASGLPHLSVREMFLIKNVAKKKMELSEEPPEILEMQKISVMLETKIQWIKFKNAFYAWTLTVIDEYENHTPVLTKQDMTEMYNTVTILRSFLKKRLKSLKGDPRNEVQDSHLDEHPSKHLRVRKSETEAENSIIYNEQFLANINHSLDEKKKIITKELKTILQKIPQCVQI